MSDKNVSKMEKTTDEKNKIEKEDSKNADLPKLNESITLTKVVEDNNAILIESDSDDDEPIMTKVSNNFSASKSSNQKRNNLSTNYLPVQKGRYTGGLLQRSQQVKPLEFGDRGFNRNSKPASAFSVKNAPRPLVKGAPIMPARKIMPAKNIAQKVIKSSYSIDELRNLAKIVRVLVIQTGLHWKCFFCKNMFSRKVDAENHIRDDHLTDENSKETMYIKKNFGFVTKPRPVQTSVAPRPMVNASTAAQRQTALRQLQNLQNKGRTQLPAISSISKFECQHCGWEIDSKAVKMKSNNMYDCDACGFESIKKVKGPLRNIAPVNALNSYYAKQKENAAINQRVKNNMRMAQFMSAKKLKLAEMKLTRDLKSNGVKRAVPKSMNRGGRFDYQMDNSPAGLLASLYPQGRPSYQVEEDLPKDASEKIPDEVTNVADEEIKTPIEEDLTKAPKSWGSAEHGGFPSGWQWKVASAWSRRIKFMSPEGKIFNARFGAVKHMEEMGTYTQEQIDMADNFEQQTVKNEQIDEGMFKNEQTDEGTLKKEQMDEGTLKNEQMDEGTLKNEQIEEGTLKNEQIDEETLKSEQMDEDTDPLQNNVADNEDFDEEFDTLKNFDIEENLADSMKTASDLTKNLDNVYETKNKIEEGSMLNTFSTFVDSL